MQTILIYNEDDHTRRTTATMLRELEFEVLEAQNSEVAHVLIDAFDFDLVISDSIENSGLNGFGLLVHSFRVNRAGARLLVSDSISENAIRSAEYIGSRCVCRPIETEKLVSVVRVLMRQAAA
jgi:DNA-binding response OmpR family regulator